MTERRIQGQEAVLKVSEAMHDHVLLAMKNEPVDSDLEVERAYTLTMGMFFGKMLAEMNNLIRRHQGASVSELEAVLTKAIDDVKEGKRLSKFVADFSDVFCTKLDQLVAEIADDKDQRRGGLG